MTINKLFTIIKSRQEKLPKNSYIASLFRGGQDRIIQKVGEEATEVVIASKNGNTNEIIAEICDLFVHILVLMASYNISLKDIGNELENRTSKKSLLEE